MVGMIKVIERSTVSNKELFDKLYEATYGVTNKSDEVLMLFATNVLHITGLHPLLMHSMNNYCAKYPYTILKSDA